jgi:uncharacterized protein (DUF2252 family)
MPITEIAGPKVDERRAQGRMARERVATSSSRPWEPAFDRPDPIALLEEQNLTRDADLVPVRHGRMMTSAFTFYRGAAKIMATDLANTVTAGLNVQLCGDAHLSNFGVYASPERVLMFDLNDFDETLPGPFEYDVRRLSASFTIAAHNNGFTASDVRSVTLASVTAYREAMAQFATMGVLEVYYAHLAEQDLANATSAAATAARKSKERAEAKKALKNARKSIAKAHTRDSLQALSKLGELVDGRYQIVSQPPTIVPSRDLDRYYGIPAENFDEIVQEEFRAYRATLQFDRRQLLERYEVVDFARKVVGVGSVGTRAFIVLLRGRDERDPLFLQLKEATASVLENHLPASQFDQPGERVVQGQRMMQAASDIFLGWTKGVEANRFLYWRQLRDMKGSAIVEAMTPLGMRFYAGLCGWTLARAHARSGDAVAIAEYLGTTDSFDRWIVAESERYAAQNDHDYQAFLEAIGSGRLQAIQGI